jgi:hypothetical protein
VVGGTQAGVLRGPEETALEHLAASMPEWEKRKARESQLGLARKGKRGGGWSGAGDAMRRQGENGARHSGSSAGATETGAGQAVSGTVREQGSGWRAWATRERGGRPGDGRS